MNAAAGASWRGRLWPCSLLLPLPKDLSALPERSHPRAQGQGPKDRGISSQRGKAKLGEARDTHQLLGEEGGADPGGLETSAPSEHELG